MMPMLFNELCCQDHLMRFDSRSNTINFCFNCGYSATDDHTFFETKHWAYHPPFDEFFRDYGVLSTSTVKWDRYVDQAARERCAKWGDCLLKA